MLTIRPYRESDAESVGRLIADTYSRFNLSFASPEELGKLLGPFRHAWSAEPAHREAIAQVIRAPLAFVAEQANGAATDGMTPILDVEPQDLHQRTPLFIGSRDDVETLLQFLRGERRHGG